MILGSGAEHRLQHYHLQGAAWVRLFRVPPERVQTGRLSIRYSERSGKAHCVWLLPRISGRELYIGAFPPLGL